MDFSLVVSYALVIALGVNNFLSPNASDINLSREEVGMEISQNKNARLVVHKTGPKRKLSKRDLMQQFKQKIKKSRRAIKREFRILKRTLKQNKNSNADTAAKAFLSLFVVGLGVFLGYLVAGLACNLSCSGKEGLAWTVLIGGWSVILWLMLFTLNKLWNKRKAVD